MHIAIVTLQISLLTNSPDPPSVGLMTLNAELGSEEEDAGLGLLGFSF